MHSYLIAHNVLRKHIYTISAALTSKQLYFAWARGLAAADFSFAFFPFAFPFLVDYAWQYYPFSAKIIRIYHKIQPIQLFRFVYVKNNVFMAKQRCNWIAPDIYVYMVQCWHKMHFELYIKIHNSFNITRAPVFP